MSMRFNLNNNQQRRVNQINNFYGSHKGWCRAAAMSRTSGASNRTHSFCANSRTNHEGGKVFFRSFRNRKLCRQFMSKLHKRYSKRFKKPLNFRINLRGNKIEYYAGEKIWKKNIKISRSLCKIIHLWKLICPLKKT